jgi:hypothetical protein
LAERRYHTLPSDLSGIDPHHLSNARRTLLNERVIEEIAGTTRGGSTVSVLAFADRRLRKTSFEEAAGRKRLLQARYIGWATGRGRLPNLVGDAGERVAHASLIEAIQAGAGYNPLKKTTTGQVANIFGRPVPGGSLDNAAFLAIEHNHQPIVISILIEVKNVRHWIYPSSEELFQLLDKAAHLQQNHPAYLFVPVLVCRRGHYTLFKMAADLGFIAFYTTVQPMLNHSRVKIDTVSEVRDELGYMIELIQADEIKGHAFVTNGFTKVLPGAAARIAHRWQQTAPTLAPFYQSLRASNLTPSQRSIQMDQLRAAAKGLPDVRGGW